ncbi:hypothetical protein FXF51_06270 [Nonomuraea sp. PA05]|uniref:hypothetical protein n=1 Tax=Nonomuraea sp. PA05 TaxID=2604466 RepID=UPI0011D8DEF3|nr:hypothetical protein [Nonomuraea sp. PA05]TYB69766.1 hypothetical protein FXF51_06270 [Nonomuraea sp. PA05]
MAEDITITMPASELEMRYRGGSMYRLVSMNGWHPPRAGGRWPLILNVDHTADDGPPLVVVEIETDTDAHGVPPSSKVKVIPVNPSGATRSTGEAQEAVNT